MDSHTMPNRLGHSDRAPSPLAQPGPSNPPACSQLPSQPHRFAHIQEVIDEKGSSSQREGTSKKPAGLTAGMSPLPGSVFPYSPAASPVSSIPPWIRSQRPPHSRPAQLQPPFSPAPCPIASSWASPISLPTASSTSTSSSSSPYTRPRALRIANLLKPWIPIILYVMTTLGFLAAVSFWKVEVFEGKRLAPPPSSLRVLTKLLRSRAGPAIALATVRHLSRLCCDICPHLRNHIP